jgi:hypothetical protein
VRTDEELTRFSNICVADCVWLAVPQATKWQRIGNQINAALISAGNGDRTHFRKFAMLRNSATNMR